MSTSTPTTVMDTSLTHTHLRGFTSRHLQPPPLPIQMHRLSHIHGSHMCHPTVRRLLPPACRARIILSVVAANLVPVGRRNPEDSPGLPRTETQTMGDMHTQRWQSRLPCQLLQQRPTTTRHQFLRRPRLFQLPMTAKFQNPKYCELQTHMSARTIM